MSSHVSVWEFWDQRYEANLANFGVKANPSLLKWLELDSKILGTGPVLVWGAGYGRDVRPMNRVGIESVGVELSRYAHLLPRDPLTEPSLYVQGDGLRWLDSQQFSKPFSGLVSIHASESKSVEGLLADAACDHLAPGAAVLYIANSCKSPPSRVMQYWREVAWLPEIWWETPEVFALRGYRL